MLCICEMHYAFRAVQAPDLVHTLWDTQYDASLLLLH